MNDPTVYFVHCVDTEGPLGEISPSLASGAGARRNYSRVPDFAHLSDSAMEKMIAHHRAHVLGTWEEVAVMLRAATAESRRMALPDSFGGGWKFNWFCMDHLDFIDNPRGRAMGMHAVFDFYQRLMGEQGAGDALHWHFHPMSTYREAHRCATSYINSPMLWEIIARRILDRRWFPRGHRAGFQDERPDSHWFLEQWIPFDFSNTTTKDIDFSVNPDLADGRFSDWRGAPDDWRTYHPHHDCHQREGHCRRKIARCLNLLGRFANLDAEELRKAFRRAAEGKPTLVAAASHDWRDLNVEMAWAQHLLQTVAREFPGVRFRHAEAIDAFNAVHPPAQRPALKLDCRLLRGTNGLPARIEIIPVAGKVFGPQPFLAVRTRSRRIIHDNLNHWHGFDDFNYIFDDESILPEDITSIGIAANDEAGNQSIHVIDIDAVPGNAGAVQPF